MLGTKSVHQSELQRASQIRTLVTGGRADECREDDMLADAGLCATTKVKIGTSAGPRRVLRSRAFEIIRGEMLNPLAEVTGCGYNGVRDVLNR